MPRGNKRVDRRSVLAKTLAVGSAVGIAGCGGDGGSSGGNGDTGGASNSTPEEGTEYELVPEYDFDSVSRSDNPLRYQIGELANNQVQQLGIRTNRNAVTVGTYADKLNNRTFDFMVAAWTGGTERLFPYYNLYFSFHSQFAGDGGGNYTMFESDEYDEAVENFVRASSLEDRVEYSNQCQAILAENIPILFAVHPDALVATSNRTFSNWQEMVGLYAYNNIPALTAVENNGNSDQMVFGTTEGLQSYPNFYGVTGPDALRMHSFTYDPLVRLDLDGEPYGAAAEDWEYVDETTVDVTLRSDMTFHDGEPVTPEDVKFTFDDISETGIPYLESDIQPYDSSEILDDSTIRFNLADPFSGFDQITLYRIPILPKHVWDGVAEEEGLEHPSEWTDPDMTGSGPFEFVDYNPGNQIVFRKNPDHYIADELDFEEFVFRIYGSQSSIIGDLEDGTVSFTQYLTTEQWNQANQSSNIDAVSNPGLDAHGVWIPNDRGIFRDVKVRKALAHAIDQEQIIALALQGNGEPAKSPIAPANQVYHNEDVTTYPYNIQRARELLSEVGFRWNDQGQLVKPVDWEPTVEYVSPN